MRPERSTLLLLAVLVANACVILFFRFFITVDGPVHVLQASLSDGPWALPVHQAQDIVYDRTGSRSLTGDTILRLLLMFLPPTCAHDVFAVVVSCALVLGVLAFLRTHGARIGVAGLWLAPITFNLLLIMGMFHFLLGVAVAFGAVAWWVGHAGSPRARWPGLVIGIAIAWYTHRASLILLGLLIALTLLFAPRAPRSAGPVTTRTARVWRIVLIVALLAVGAAAAWRLTPLLRWVIGAPDGILSFRASDLLQPFMLLERPKELWPVQAIGVLLLVSSCAAVQARWRMGRDRCWHDALLVLFVSLAVLSGLYGTHAGHKAFIAERSRTLAVLCLILWLVAIAGVGGKWVRGIIAGAALCALPLHLVRLVRLEDKMAPLRDTCVRALCATEKLAPGALVVPWVVDPHPLLQHMEAYVAIGHDGIVVAPDEHIKLVLPPKLVWRYWLRTEDRAWLMRRWRAGVPPEVDQLLLIGADVDQAVQRHPWPALLSPGFRITYGNNRARVYTAMRF